MKRFPDTYNEANKMAKKYSSAPRAGWVEQEKRTKANQAILVGRQEAVQLAARSATMFTAPDGWKGDAHIAKRRKRAGAE